MNRPLPASPPPPSPRPGAPRFPWAATACVLALALPSVARADEAPAAFPPSLPAAPSTAPDAPSTAPPTDPLTAPAAHDDSQELTAARRKAREHEDRLGWAVPDYARLQTGGYLGAVSLGLGYSVLKDILNITAAYAFVPAQGQAPHRHMGWAQLHVRPLHLSLGDSAFVVPIYLGAGALIASGKDIFLSEPSVYTKGYYPPTARHWLFSFGAEVGLRGADGDLIRKHSLFVEEVTIDQYLDALTQNKNSTLVDAFSTSLGYRATF